MSGIALPGNWQPTEADVEYGRTICRLSPEQIQEYAEDMRLWAGANANRQIGRKSNWSMAFKSWMRREAKKRNGGQINGYGRSSALADVFEQQRSGYRAFRLRQPEMRGDDGLFPQGGGPRPSPICNGGHGGSGGISERGDRRSLPSGTGLAGPSGVVSGEHGADQGGVRNGNGELFPAAETTTFRAKLRSPISEK